MVREFASKFFDWQFNRVMNGFDKLNNRDFSSDIYAFCFLGLFLSVLTAEGLTALVGYELSRKIPF